MWDIYDNNQSSLLPTKDFHIFCWLQETVVTLITGSERRDQEILSINYSFLQDSFLTTSVGGIILSATFILWICEHLWTRYVHFYTVDGT